MIAIVGGGAAGTFLAMSLAGRGIRSIVFDRSGSFGRGLAYGAPSPWHRLNVPMEKIGKPGPGERESFAAFYARRHGPLGDALEDRFVPRHAYGTWLCEQLDWAVTGGHVTCREAAITRLDIGASGVTLTDEAGGVREAERAVLCIGNRPPRRLPGIPPEGCVPDVWADGAFDVIATDDPVTIVGTGATAVDAFLELRHRGHKASVTMVSRRGLLPLVEIVPEPYRATRDFLKGGSLRDILAMLRAEIRDGQEAGAGWQIVLDAFRDNLPAIWAALSADDRRRFARHLRSIWLVHRHRLAPDISRLLEREQREGSLKVMAARIVGAVRQGRHITIAVRHGRRDETLQARWVVNCTGPEDHPARWDDPLVTALLQDGTIRPGQFGIGIDVDASCRATRLDGRVSDRLMVLGSTTRMRFGEITSAPQIRQQADGIARLIAGL